MKPRPDPFMAEGRDSLEIITPQGISGSIGWPAAPGARESRFHLFRSERLTEIHRPGRPPSSLTNLGSPVQILITAGFLGSRQTVILIVQLTKLLAVISFSRRGCCAH
jgi:hypothetical protein